MFLLVASLVFASVAIDQVESWWSKGVIRLADNVKVSNTYFIYYI